MPCVRCEHRVKYKMVQAERKVKARLIQSRLKESGALRKRRPVGRIERYWQLMQVPLWTGGMLLWIITHLATLTGMILSIVFHFISKFMLCVDFQSILNMSTWCKPLVVDDTCIHSNATKTQHPDLCLTLSEKSETMFDRVNHCPTGRVLGIAALVSFLLIPFDITWNWRRKGPQRQCHRLSSFYVGYICLNVNNNERYCKACFGR